MKIIEKGFIDKILKVYKPEQRVLKSVSIEYPEIYGKFLIGPTYYTCEPFRHATDIEIQLCLNQLAYVGVADLIKRGNIRELGNLDFFKLQGEEMFIIESWKRFRKQMNSDKELMGELRIDKLKDVGKLIMAKTSFEFEHKSCFGELELVIVKS